MSASKSLAVHKRGPLEAHAAGRAPGANRGARHRVGSATVNIHVRDVAQLFNSLDPSPFWDRDLDRDAATFIEEEP
jgi:hypothetical protein